LEKLPSHRSKRIVDKIESLSIHGVIIFQV
jgi:hypothetical protein